MSVQIGYLFGGIIGVEKVFNYSGLGSTMLGRRRQEGHPRPPGRGPDRRHHLHGVDLAGRPVDRIPQPPRPSVGDPMTEINRTDRYSRCCRRTCGPRADERTKAGPQGELAAHPAPAVVHHRQHDRRRLGVLCAVGRPDHSPPSARLPNDTPPAAHRVVPVRHRHDRARRAVARHGRSPRRAQGRAARRRSSAWCSA